jgi:hypothetical protein
MAEDDPGKQLAIGRPNQLSNKASSNDVTPMPSSESPVVSTADPLKIAAAFQLQIFRTQDSRLSNLDALGGIVVAAAIAVATFTGSLMKNEHVSIPGLVATGLLCVVTVAIALYARRERPKGRGKPAKVMRRKGKAARRAVALFQEKVRTEQIHDAAETARLEFNASYALSESINARKKVKVLYFLLAIIFLLLEVAAAIFSAYMSR